MLLGFLIIMVGIFVVILGSLLLALKSKKTKVEWGVGGFIGFLPFGFWSSKNMMYVVIVLTFLCFFLLLILSRAYF